MMAKYLIKHSHAIHLLGAIKFYNNGCVNWFSIPNNDSIALPELNPNKTGYKGISYKKKVFTM